MGGCNATACCVKRTCTDIAGDGTGTDFDCTLNQTLSTHGLDDLGDKLHRMSVEGKWAEMPGEVSDEVLGLFAAIAPYDGIAAAIEERFGGLSDSVGIGFPADAPAAQVREVLADVRRIPTLFETFRTDWRD